jgi:hypothetical protein
MAEVAEANSPDARADSGEILDVRTTRTEPTATEPTKPEGTTLATKEGETPPKAEAPTEYAEFKVPEGFELASEVSKEAGGLFKEMGLNQEQAQKLVDFYVTKNQESAEQPFKAYENLRKEWVDQVKADPEIGSRDGMKAEVRQTISRGLDAIGNPALVKEFKDAMDLTGAGDHPAFIKAFHALAKMVTEGEPVRGNGPSPAGQLPRAGRPVSPAKALFPKLPSAYD